MVELLVYVYLNRDSPRASHACLRHPAIHQYTVVMAKADGISAAINRFLCDPNNKDILAIIKGCRNGIVYGCKVRFPHAIVMVFLFRSGSFREKMSIVLKATRQHSRNLATFIVIYKSIMYILRTVNGKENQPDALLAGLIGGYYVFGRGRQSSVNQQIVLYVAARVCIGLAKLSVSKGLIPNPDGKVGERAWPLFAAMSWGLVMYLFRWDQEVIQPSLRSSMRYLYVKSDSWDSWRNFLLHNE